MLPTQVEQDDVIIEDGLRPGEKVVVEGQFKLQQGSRVRMADATGKAEARTPKPEGKQKSEGRGKTKS